jgi:hypothetical protein
MGQAYLEMVDWLGTAAFLSLIAGLVWVWVKACTSAHEADGE